ncbi:MAG: sugar ABC transporter permease [Sphaerochaeta sp.]|nr:sugar ABC transporter permease [Sphaerochaeta sp.]
MEESKVVKNKRMIQKRTTELLFIFPALLIIGLLLLYPVLSSIYYSFTSKHLIKQSYKFVGFKNYSMILMDLEFYRALFTSLKWTLVSLFGQLLIGFTAALALNRIKKGQGFFRTVLIIPWAFPTIVIALVWKWILNGVSGFIPHMLVKIGVCSTLPQFYSDPRLVFGTLVFINIWFGFPLIMVNVLSALQTVPKEQYEAAEIDGASKWQSFLLITIPHIRIIVGLLVVLRTIWIFNNFDLVYLITGGGPANITATVPIYAYNLGWGLKQLGGSSAVTIILLLILISLSILYFRLLNKWEKEDA